MLNDHYLNTDIEEIVLASSILSYATSKVSSKRFHELKTGQISWEAKLDVSNLQAEDARSKLLEFIQKQVHNKKYSILLIHGSKSPKNSPPLLKNLINYWLPQIKEVAAFHSARPEDGGTDAVYVMLRELPNVPVLIGTQQNTSFLVAETKTMERERRLVEQQGERRKGPVKARDHAMQANSSPSLEGDLQQGPMQHPLLATQRFDGVDEPLNPEPALNTDARREFDNERRNQEQEKQLRLGNMPKFSSTPKPRGPQ